jgi:hypothetical protein
MKCQPVSCHSASPLLDGPMTCEKFTARYVHASGKRECEKPFFREHGPLIIDMSVIASAIMAIGTALAFAQ